MNAEAAIALGDADLYRDAPQGGSGAQWEDPDWSILDDRRGELPEFPGDVFSPRLHAWLERSAHGAGVTTAHVAVPLLGIASSLIGVSRCINPCRSWSEPCSMWTAIVGFSGTGKTPGIDVTKRALAQIARDRKGKIVGLELAHETRVEAAKFALARWKAEVEAAVEAGQPPPQMPAEAINPGPFNAPRPFVSNATIERLAVLLQAQPRGMLMIADELAALFSNMVRYSRGHDNEFWLEAYNGKPYAVERMGRPPVMVEHLLVGVVGGFQPDKLARSFEGDNDGMYARFCFAWPSEPHYRPLTNDADDIDPVIYNALVGLIDLASEEEGVFASRKIRLSEDALAEFEKFRLSAHEQRSDLDGREREWFDKGPSHVLRLAGTLAYLNWAAAIGTEESSPGPTSIEVGVVTDAIRLVRTYFWPHSRAALRQVGLSERHANARQVLKWVRHHHREEVSREDVRREALAQKLDAEQTSDLLNVLVKAGWCRETDASKARGRRARRWRFSPLLFKSAAEIAEIAETPPNSAIRGISAISAISAVE
jgi:hypothetical protein